MSIKIKLVLCCVAWVAAAVGSAGNAFAADPIFYQVKILYSGTSPTLLQKEEQKTRLTRFVERLRTELIVGNLGEANIGCDRCGELVLAEKVEGLTPPGGDLTSLEFFLHRNGAQLDALLSNVSQLEAFARSYDFIQTSELGSRAFAMEIVSTLPPASACSTAQLAKGCKTRALCFQTGGCDKVYGGSCDLCPP